jgi:AAA+ ATPase superfamily predicted ATPase
LRFLQEQYNTSQGKLVIIYGRRRIGKTELLREFCKNKEHVFYTSIECTDSAQLELFSKQLLSTSMEASKFITSFSGWEQAFSSITTIPSKGKRLVIIDEFPYMAGGDMSILSILQKLWDSTFKEENVMLVLCGSSMSFMENKVLSETTPLYGRATGILKMNPMGFYEAIQFFPHYSAFDKILA